MPQDVRREFGRLNIEDEREQFMQFPSSPTLFRDLAIYQNVATSQLAAKNILDRNAYLSGISRLNVAALSSALATQAASANDADHEFMNFLVERFGKIELDGSRGLRSLTGLVRRRT
jgi:hypothetical protein